MPNYRVSYGFAQLPDADLGDFNNAVITSMTGNASFTKPAVTIAAQTAAGTTFNAAVVAAAQGGLQLTAAKNVAREALLALLRQQASYVQSVANNDLPTILSSGFQVNNTNRAQSPLDKPIVVGIENAMSQQLLLRLQSIANARAYEVRLSYGANGWQAAGVFTQARAIVLEQLTPGTTYTVQVRAVGGSTGYSDWSDPVSHMAL